MKLLSKILSTFILCIFFTVASYADCHWNSTYCPGSTSEYESYCLNVGANTIEACTCGTAARSCPDDDES